MPQKVIQKAGTLPIRQTDTGATEVLIITLAPDSFDRLIFPMGKVKPGESDKQAAQRETREEAGVEVEVKDFLGELRWEADEQFHSANFYIGRYVADVEWIEKSKRLRKWITLHEALDAMPPDFVPFVKKALELREN